MDEQAGKGGPGTLYVVSTPIGNLEDITLRALRVMKEVDLIAAESVEHTRALCRHFGIQTKLTSYNQHNQGAKGPALIRMLREGSSVALVTNAGTPGVSDPGVLLARQAAEAGVGISPVPGPSAVTAALSISGMRGERFVFCGFLSSRAGKRRTELKELVSEKRTLVFFEAPHRIEDMLRDLLELLGDRRMLLIREISKVHEEVIHAKVGEVAGRLKGRARGEFTLVVEGAEGTETDAIADARIKKTIVKLMSKNIMSVRDVARMVAEKEGVPWRKVYRACLAIRGEEESSAPPAPEVR